MKLKIFLYSLIVLFFLSCDDTHQPSGSDSIYFIYAIGEKGKQIEISYLERETVKLSGKDHDMDGNPIEYGYGDKNVIKTETVELPFFKEAHVIQFIGESVPDCFFKIQNNNSDSIKAVIFDDSYFIVRNNNERCYSVVGNLTGKTDNYGSEDCDTCITCKGLTADSVWAYFKTTEYPCYMELSKDDLSKEVRLYDYWGYSSK